MDSKKIDWNLLMKVNSEYSNTIDDSGSPLFDNISASLDFDSVSHYLENCISDLTKKE